MKIIINNKETIVEDDITVAELLRQLNYKGWVAVIINGHMLMEGGYENTILMESDMVKIIKPLFGG